MKAVKDFFRQRWVITLIGLIALIILVWFGGPYLGLGSSQPLASRFSRLLLVLILVIIWGLHNLWLQLRSRQTNARMVEDMGQAEDDGAALTQQSAEEAATLRERFGEAMAILKRTRMQGSRGRHYVYELPWYVIIGPPGAGKTTALANSGLEFPLAEHFGKDAVRGVGGTRNCDWWFTNDAVLLDTAGRYTTQDSQQSVDSAAWHNFLSLLKKFRPRRPINGILVAISLDDVAQQGSEAREQHARAIRQRIGELYERLGVQVPIYLIFTKVDLLAGFTEVFDDMDREQRAQVWGVTLDGSEAPGADGIAARFGAEYDALLARINQRMLWRLQEERDVTRRGLIHGFPQQMATIKPALENFLEIAFRSNRYEQKAPRVRGIYFTSGTQEGAPIDRIMASLARNFGVGAQALAAHRNQGRSYFLTRLLRDVVFHEAELVGTNRRFEKQLRLLRIGGYAIVLGLGALVIVAWAAGFARNQSYLSALDQRVNDYHTAAHALTPQADLTQALPVLNAASNLAGTYTQNGDHSPWTLGMGLFHARELASESRAAYRRVLQGLLLPYLDRRVESALIRDAEHPEALQKALTVYLMLGSPDTLQPTVVQRWALQDVASSLGDGTQGRTQFQGHLENLFSGPVPASQPDPQLLAQARQAVCRIPLADQVYSRLVQLAEGAKLPSFSLNTVGPDVARYFRASAGGEIPGLYTAHGYQTIMVKETPALTSQVIDQNRRVCEGFDTASADAKAISSQIQKRYFSEYTTKWDTFLSNLHITGFEGAAQSATTLKVLSGDDSPMAKLLTAIAGQLALPAAAPAASPAASDESKKAPETQLVSAHYRDLVALTAAKGDNPPPLAGLLATLGEVRDYLFTITASADSGKAAYTAAAQSMASGGDASIAKLRRMAADLPAPVAGWMNVAATHVWGSVLGGAHHYVNQQWRAIVVEPYRASLQGRYPLSRDASKQATLADFGRFFGPGGILPGFVKDYLQPFVDTRTWRLNSAGHGTLGLSSASLRMLRNGAAIGRLFFHEGGQQPEIKFSLTPVDLSAGASRFTLDVGGQSIEYRHGPRRRSNMQWPGPDGQGARLVFRQIGGGDLTSAQDGPWAWFKLLDAAKLEAGGSADIVKVTFSAGKLQARYQLRASSVNNPFSSDALRQFHLPDAL